MLSLSSKGEREGKINNNLRKKVINKTIFPKSCNKVFEKTSKITDIPIEKFYTTKYGLKNSMISVETRTMLSNPLATSFISMYLNQNSKMFLVKDFKYFLAHMW